MHDDARTLPDGTEIESDLCIVGAGAAGITIARAFANTTFDVALLEAGGFSRESATQALYAGENTGLPYYPLNGTRLRYFGGTTNHWSGWCSPLDPIDFMERDWVPESGWPFARSDLDPYYRRAQALCELGAYCYDTDCRAWPYGRLTPLPFDASTIRTKVFQQSAPTRFGRTYRADIVRARNITLWTHANVTDIRTPEHGTEVAGLRVRCLNGKVHRVRARYYVLACGGLENPRLLLANGLGNEYDVVGRYFMEHPHIFSGTLVLARPPGRLYNHPIEQGDVFGMLALSPRAQRRHRVLNYTAFLRHNVDRALPQGMYGHVPYLTHVESRFKRLFNAATTFTLDTRIEQRPNPNSRVMLSAEKDALGVPRIRLHWTLTEQEKRTIRVANEAIARECGRLGIGRVRLSKWVTDEGNAWPDALRGGNHHMGTTRMSTSPQRGVVDADCRVHGIRNLYVAGSSVYPTSGAANPTLTLVALALRLADHLGQRMRT